jgi:hypothetical protein
MRFILSAILAMCMSMNVSAFVGFRSVELTCNDGEVLTLSLSPEFLMEFSSGEMNITTAADSYCLMLGDVKLWRFTDAFVAENDALTAVLNEGDIRITPYVNKIVIDGLHADSHVVVADVNGIVVWQMHGGGMCNVAIDNLPSGVYVLNVDGVSAKIAVK